MLRFFLLFAIFFIAVKFSFGQNELELLEQGYTLDSADLYRQFLNESIDRSNQTLQAGRLNDTVLMVQKVLTAFLSPENFDTIEGTALSPMNYTTHTHVLVQNSLGIYFTNRLYYTQWEIDSIGLAQSKLIMMDTKPPISLYESIVRNNQIFPHQLLWHIAEDEIKKANRVVKKDSIVNANWRLERIDKKIVSLSPSVDSALIAFLKHKYVAAGRSLITLSLEKESSKRKKAINEVVNFWYCKRGKYWQLVSYPYIDQLIFDRKMKYALLKIKLSYGSANVMLRNNKDEWKVIAFKRDE